MKFDGHTRGHHAYKEIWTSQKVDILYCKKDYRSEVLDIGKHVMGIYKEDRLVGHVPIELSQLFHTLYKRVKQTKWK